MSKYKQLPDTLHRTQRFWVQGKVTQ